MLRLFLLMPRGGGRVGRLVRGVHAGGVRLGREGAVVAWGGGCGATDVVLRGIRRQGTSRARLLPVVVVMMMVVAAAAAVVVVVMTAMTMAMARHGPPG